MPHPSTRTLCLPKLKPETLTQREKERAASREDTGRRRALREELQTLLAQVRGEGTGREELQTLLAQVRGGVLGGRSCRHCWPR